MLKWLFIIACLVPIIANAQSWLDPASFPNASGPCTPDSQMLSEYEMRYRGTLTYPIRTTPADPAHPGRFYSPTIDGILEDSIWFYAETLLINSWEDAGSANACGEPRLFKGPLDIHVIWRFCYNHDGLYVGIEVHDDVHDVDSLGGWYEQDGVQFCIDPSDWGDNAAGMWTKGTNIFRRYYSNNATIIPYTDNAQTAYIMLLKRMNDEPYLCGLLNATYKSSYGRGQEASNFKSGDYGIQFAAKSQGTDPWFRSVWHMEFKFPYHGELYSALEGRGFYDPSGLPQTGNLFKMDFFNNDDDIVGPNGSKGGFKQVYRRRDNSAFLEEASGHDHWSDTKYNMVMKYDGASLKEVVHPYFGGVRVGDRRLARSWVDVATETLIRISFTGDGTVKMLDSLTYYYDSTGTTGGKISSRTDSVGSYAFSQPAGTTPGALTLKDTLKVTFGGSTLTLIPELVTGYTQVEGRWVEARLEITPNARGCGNDSAWKPVSGAREFRFCPMSKIRVDAGTYPQYVNCKDSLRIYDFATGALQSQFTYTADRVILGRDSVYCSMEYGTLFRSDNSNAVRNLILTYRNGDHDTLMAWNLYSLTKWGESGNNKNQSFIMYSALAQGTRELWRLRVMDKYKPEVRIYPDSMTKTVSYLVGLYPDMMMDMDTLVPNFWSQRFPVSFTVDSMMFTAYDSASATGSGLVAKADTTVFPDSAWLRQVCQVKVQYGPSLFDSFAFVDTTHSFWAFGGPNGEVPVTMPPNGIYPFCPSVEEGALVSTTALWVSNYPNPFNPSTIIRFAIPPQKGEQRYALNLYNVRGQLVRALVKGKVGNAGLTKKVVWDGTDNAGRAAGTGVYFYRLVAGTRVLKGTLVMVK